MTFALVNLVKIGKKRLLIYLLLGDRNLIQFGKLLNEKMKFKILNYSKYDIVTFRLVCMIGSKYWEKKIYKCIQELTIYRLLKNQITHTVQ